MRTDYYAYSVGPYRTIQKKFKDFSSIDKKMSELNAKNDVLRNAISELQEKITSLTQSFKNVKGMNKADVQKQIKSLNAEVAAKEQELQKNKELITELWYGYHERV